MSEGHSEGNDVIRFRLRKDEDPHGVTGTGVVAVGGVLPSGAAFLEFLNNANDGLQASNNGFAYHPGEDGLEDLREIRVRDNDTYIKFVDSDLNEIPVEE